MVKQFFKMMLSAFESFYKMKQKKAADKLYQAAIDAVKLPEYKKGFPDGRTYPGTDKLVTYCNVFARDFLTMFGLIKSYNYDLLCLCDILKNEFTDDPNKILLYWTGIDVAYKNAIKAAALGIIIEHTPESAQQKANVGIPIWIVTLKYGHEAIVIPDETPFNSDRGVKIAQAGEVNGIFYWSDIISPTYGMDHKDKEIKYYEFKEKLTI
jgi:hypothetical protein